MLQVWQQLAYLFVIPAELVLDRGDLALFHRQQRSRFVRNPGLFTFFEYMPGLRGLIVTYLRTDVMGVFIT